MIVRVYPGREAASRAGAENFVRCLKETLGRKDRFSIAVSGGSTPRRLYEILGTEFINEVEWERVNIYWGDERYVPHQDRKSNFRMFHEALLDQVSIPIGNVHPMPTHRRDPQAAADDYESLMRSHLAGSGRGHPDLPELDIVLLGMGADGHVASLFPGSKALQETRRWVVATEAPEEPRQRLSLTLSVINNAADVCLLVTGGEKAEAVERAIAGPPDALECPASAVRPTHGQVVWWLDQAAASRLEDANTRIEHPEDSTGGR